MNALTLPPLQLCAAFVNLSALAKLGDTCEKMLLLEQMETGIWLVAVTEHAVAASWVPFDPANVESPPSFDDEPVADAYWVGDGEQRIRQLLAYELKIWKKAKIDAGFDQYVHISPSVDPSKQQSIPGTQRPWVRFTTPHEHVDAPCPEVGIPNWRQWFRTVGHSERGDFELPLPTMAALAKIEGGCRLEFGTGTHAMMTIEPPNGAMPVTFVRLQVARREGTVEEQITEAFEGLVQQEFADGEYHDVEEDDDEPDVPESPLRDPGRKLPAPLDGPSDDPVDRALTGALADLGIG